MEIVIVKPRTGLAVHFLSLLAHARSPPRFISHTNKLVVASTKSLVNELLFQTSELIAVCWQNSALTSYKLRLLPGFFA